MADEKHLLTKSGFLDFLHCPNNFWLTRRRPDLHVEAAPSDFDRLLMMDGYAVEALAREMLEGREDGSSFEFQVDLECDGCLARADAIRTCHNGTIEIYEIKSSTSASDHIEDAAFQRIVAERMGHSVAGSFVVHVNKDYRLKGELDVNIVTEDFLEAPISKGQVVGHLVLSQEGEVRAERPLIALNDVEEAGFFGRLWGSIKLFFARLFA